MDGSQPKDSLILREEAQSKFQFDIDVPVIERKRPPFHCDGERLYRDRPDVYESIVRALAAGHSQRIICETHHCSMETLRAVKEREQTPIEEQKQRLLRNFVHGAIVASERVNETLPTASTKDAALVCGIFTDKAIVLGGDVSARIVVEHKGPEFSSIEEYERELSGIVEKYASARVIDESAPAGPALTNGEGVATSPAKQAID